MTDYYEDVHMTDVNTSSGGNGQFGSKGDEERKLFLGGLSWDTEEQDILNYFSKFGHVTNVSIKYDTITGKPRGFGFITFESVSPIEAVLAGGPHMIRNRAVDPKRPRAKPSFKKIFVGGIDADMPEDEIKDYFQRFGNVEGIECPFDRQRGRRREFCFIIFDTEEAAEAAVNEPKQLIGNKECDIKKAQPQRFQSGGTPSRGQTQYFGHSSGGRGSGSGGSGWSMGYQAGRENGAWSNGSGAFGGGGGSFGGQPFRRTYTNSNYYPSNY